MEQSVVLSRQEDRDKKRKKRKMLYFDCARKNQMAKVIVSKKSMPDTEGFLPRDKDHLRAE